MLITTSSTLAQSLFMHLYDNYSVIIIGHRKNCSVGDGGNFSIKFQNGQFC